MKRKRAKYTRKQHFTRFLTGFAWPFGHGREYLDWGRKRKKLAKRHAEKCHYYDKEKGVCVYNPNLLSIPFAKAVVDYFAVKLLPPERSTTLKFMRTSDE